MYKGVIFDFNGTLYEDTDLQEEAWAALIRDYFHRDMGPSEFRDRFLGLGNADILKYINSLDPDRHFDITITDEKEEVYRRICREQPERVRFLPGVPEMLDALKAAGVPIAIATASEITNVNFYYEFFGLERWFKPENIIYDDRTFPLKPAPDIYLRAAAALGLDLSECVVCEDSLNGLRAAKAAGAGRIIARRQELISEIVRNDPEIYAVIDDYYGFYPKYLEE